MSVDMVRIVRLYTDHYSYEWLLAAFYNWDTGYDMHCFQIHFLVRRYDLSNIPVYYDVLWIVRLYNTTRIQ